MKTSQIDQIAESIAALELIIQSNTTTDDEKQIAMKKMDSLIGRLFTLGKGHTIPEVLDKLDYAVQKKLKEKI